jgi:Putative peptidoglycan binding domain
MRRRSGVLLAIGAVVVVGGSFAASGLASTPAAAQPTAPTTGTATVARKTLVATTAVDGTLGYAGSYSVANLVSFGAGAASFGVLTEIAGVGSVVEPGGVLYRVGSQPVVLMSGNLPAWRTLKAGVTDGTDIQELESNLRAFGYVASSMTVDDHWDAYTTAAVKAWQKALGLDQTGDVPLGQIVFEPTAVRVTADIARPGAAIQTGTAILEATSPTPVVTVALDPALQTKLKAGDTVSVAMPGGRVAAGTVSNVGTVATVPQVNQPGGNPTPTIAVTIGLDDPASTGGLDQAPVNVSITTATAENVLAVPVSALVELLEGGYAVQVRTGDGTLRYLPVQLGLFANGWVEVSGPGLSEGQIVVVAQ